jgi:dolichol-phosphate mannosyltransferase
MPAVYVMLPTYNEKDNVRIIVSKILLQNSDIKIIAVDDSSPDGTGKILDELAEQNKNRIFVLHRQEKGRGTAGIEGFKKALKLGAEYIIEMDADGSHDPVYINDLLHVIIEEGFDVAIGSRYITSGSITDRGWIRNITSDIANFYNQVFLRLRNIKDTSGGYKCYKRKVLENVDLDTIVSRGYSIGAEILYRASKLGHKMKEIPIVFQNRMVGKSKTGISEYFRYIWTVFVIWIGGLLNIRIFHLFLAGAAGALINIFLFLWLVKFWKINYLIAGSISLIVNMFFNLFTEKVYATTKRLIPRGSTLKFFVSLVATVSLNILLLWIMIDIAELGFFISSFLIIIIISFINFIFNRAWVFASPARAEIFYKEFPASFYDDQLEASKVGWFRAWYHNARNKRLTKFIEKYSRNIPDPKIADIGCGSCNWNINALPVIGVDVNKGMLESAKNAGRLVDFKEASLDDTGLPNVYFDVVVAAEVLERITNPDNFFKEVSRILKPGGKFLVSVPYDFFPSPFYILFNIHCFIKGYIFEDDYYKNRCGHVFHFTKKSFRHMLYMYKFKVKNIFVVNGFLIYSCSEKE